MTVLPDENKLMTDHEYDGIKELDNSLPPWWLGLFFATIAFGVVYGVGYEITGWFNKPEQEYQAELALRKNYKIETRLLTDSTSLAEGKKIFLTNCVACHGQHAQGGPIGPNLTDAYWLHGQGTIFDVVKTVTNGVAGKGMVPWKKLGAKKILEVASYVLSLQGSNPKGSKKPQGKLIEEKK